MLVSQPRIIGSRSYFLAEDRAFALVPEATALPTGITALGRPATVPPAVS